MNFCRFQYRPTRMSLSHHETGRVCAARLMISVSVSCRVFGSIVGTIGCGFATNSIGTPVSVLFQRSAIQTLVLPGNARPTRVLNES